MAMKVGQKVKVRRLIDRIPAKMVETIKKNPRGTVTGFKPVDGSGVGVVIEFDNNLSTWFFEDEVEPA